MTEPNAVFVYGTLKRGEMRGAMWPRPPLAIEPATTFGRLFDLGPHPAMIPGDDLILGEVWSLAAEDMPETLRVLDIIEGFQQGEPDEYVRQVVECRTLVGNVVRAHTYFYAKLNDLRCMPVVPPDSNGDRCWTGNQKTS